MKKLTLTPQRRFRRNFLTGTYKGLRVSAHRSPHYESPWYAVYIEGRQTLIRHVSPERIEAEGLSDYLAEAAMKWIDKRMSWDPDFARRARDTQGLRAGVAVIDDPIAPEEPTRGKTRSFEDILLERLQLEKKPEDIFRMAPKRQLEADENPCRAMVDLEAPEVSILFKDGRLLRLRDVATIAIYRDRSEARITFRDGSEQKIQES